MGCYTSLGVGVGLRSAARTSQSAFWASWAVCDPDGRSPLLAQTTFGLGAPKGGGPEGGGGLKPPGLHTTAREPKRTFQGAFKNRACVEGAGALVGPNAEDDVHGVAEAVAADQPQAQWLPSNAAANLAQR